MTSRITTDIDFDQSGKHQGFLRLPYSSHISAYGWIAIPVIVINNGSGPSVLLTAGNHGDEYEGQIALLKLSRELQTNDVQGRLVIIPNLNYPAAQAGLRTSPLDQGNLNRSFPGDPDGSPTAMIAHYVESVLLPMMDYSLDLHSGGSSLMYIPSATAAKSDDPQRTAKIIELLRVFAAPIGFIFVPQGEDRTMAAATERSGVIGLSTELGGGGTTTTDTLSYAEQGIGRVLHHIGSMTQLQSALKQSSMARLHMSAEQPAESRIMEVANRDYYVFSSDRGLWEPLADLGDDVAADQPAAAVHFPDTPWREPEIVRFKHQGTVICRRMPSRVERGDCLFHLATDYPQ